MLNRTTVAIAFALFLLAPVAVAAAPDNDQRATPRVLALGVESTGSTMDSTAEANETLPCGMGPATVWFTFQLEGAQNVTIDSFGSSFDTVLAVYSGGSLIACNDQFNGSQSLVSFPALGNVTYHVQLGGWQSGGTTVAGVEVPPIGAAGRNVTTARTTAMGDYEVHLMAKEATPTSVDLVFWSASVCCRSNNAFREGETLWMDVTIRNNGTASTTQPLTITWAIDGVQVGTSTQTFSLFPGSFTFFSRSAIAAGIGNHTFTAIIDMNETIAESNESNNVVTLSYAVIPTPDLAVRASDLRRLPLVTEVGETRHPLSRFEVDVETCNIGQGGISFASLSYSVVAGSGHGTSSGSASIGSDNVGSLAPGACSTRTVRFDAFGVVGDFTFVASGFADGDTTPANNVGRVAGFNLVANEGGVVLPNGARRS